MKIALGTAQFGLDYGVSNVAGRVSAEEVARILGTAHSAGVRVLDTAWAYGDAERVLGELRAAERFEIITKTAPLDEGGPRSVAARVRESFARLGGVPIHGLLAHHAGDLLGAEGPQIAAMMRGFRTGGEVERIGVSAYTGQDLFAALEVLGDVDFVQVPTNVLDQRFVTSGAFAKLKARNVEVHIRSAFLQGLLLMDPEDAPEYFEPIRGHLAVWRSFCEARELSPLAASLGFVTGLAEVDQVVVGVESAEQLTQVLSAAAPLGSTDYAGLALNDQAFIDPSRWQVAR